VGQNPALLASTLPGLNTAVLVMMNMVFIIIIWLNFVHVESFSVNGILEYIPIIFGKITFMDCRAVSSLYSKFYMQSSFMKIIFFFFFFTFTASKCWLMELWFDVVFVIGLFLLIWHIVKHTVSFKLMAVT
jgi:hypothetical protein